MVFKICRSKRLCIKFGVRTEKLILALDNNDVKNSKANDSDKNKLVENLR